MTDRLTPPQIVQLLADEIAAQRAPARPAPAPAHASRQIGAQAAGAQPAHRPTGARLPAAASGVTRNAPAGQDAADTSGDYRHAILHSLVIGPQRRVGGLLGGGIEGGWEG